MAAQGPYSAQIQRAINGLLAGDNTWTGTNTFTGTVTFGTLSATKVLVGDGTAAAPSYSFTSDTDTGSYLVSPNTLGFASAGALQAQVENGAFRLQASTFFAIGNDVILARDAPNALALRNGTNAQTLRIGPAAAYLTISKVNASDATISTVDSTTLAFGTSNTVRWNLVSSGHLLANVDNTYDIGASGATRPRTLYVGTSVVSPAYTFNGTTGKTGATCSAFTAGGCTTSPEPSVS